MQYLDKKAFTRFRCVIDYLNLIITIARAKLWFYPYWLVLITVWCSTRHIIKIWFTHHNWYDFYILACGAEYSEAFVINYLADRIVKCPELEQFCLETYFSLLNINFYRLLCNKIWRYCNSLKSSLLVFSEIWQTFRLQQHCCQGACQISERWDKP